MKEPASHRTGARLCLHQGGELGEPVLDPHVDPQRSAVIALDNRGHGQSSKLYDPDAYHTGKMADDVAALLDQLRIERADVMAIRWARVSRPISP